MNDRCFSDVKSRVANGFGYVYATENDSLFTIGRTRLVIPRDRVNLLLDRPPDNQTGWQVSRQTDTQARG